MDRENSKGLYVKLTCPNNNVYSVCWNDFRRGISRCTCYICTNSRVGGNLKLSKREITEIFLSYDLIPIEEVKDITNKIYCINNEGYYIKVSIRDLRKIKSIKDYNWRPFIADNKYQYENIMNYCKINRPEYTILKQLKAVGQNDNIIIKYIGYTDNKNLVRYFRTSRIAFLNRGILHPDLKIKSIGEDIIKKSLKRLRINFKQGYRFQNCRYKYPLIFDFVIFKNDKINIVIEYDGIQHFKEVPYFNQSHSFNERLLCDKIKTDYCKVNNITLLRIPYTKINKIDSILKSELLINDK